MSIDQQYQYPLSLQMGAVTGAVDDLMHGYEQLVQTLPKISDNVKKVHFNTESMAKELEQRTRQIVEGYEYLEGISSSIPSALTSVAEANRKAILDSVQMNDLFTGFQAQDGDFQKQLNKIKAELHSITQERVVNLVFSREVIHDAKRIKSSRSGTPLHLRSNKTSSQVKADNKVTSSSMTAQKLKVDASTHSILIPEYIPPEKRASKQKTSTTTRYVDSALMVPSMRQGSLPNEIKNLKTTPGKQPVFISSTQQRSTPRARNHTSQLKSISNKLDKNEADISQLKDQLLLTAKRSDSEKGKVGDKLKEIAANFEKKQHARDEAVVASVHKLMKGTVECISEHLDMPRNGPVDFPDDSYQGYKVLAVTSKNGFPTSASPEQPRNQTPPPKLEPSSPRDIKEVEQQSSAREMPPELRNEYYDYSATKTVVYQLEGDHDSGVRWMKSMASDESASNQFNSSAMLFQPSNLVKEANYIFYNSRNGRTIVSATQHIPVHRHENVEEIRESSHSNGVTSSGLEDRLDIIILEGQADDKHHSFNRPWSSDEQEISSHQNYNSANASDTACGNVMGYPEPNIFIDHIDAFDTSSIRRDPLLRSRVKAVLKNKVAEELISDASAVGDVPEKGPSSVDSPPEVIVSTTPAAASLPAPSINNGLLEWIQNLVQAQREDAKETQSMLFSLLKSREEKDNINIPDDQKTDEMSDPEQRQEIIEQTDDVDIPSIDEKEVDDDIHRGESKLKNSDEEDIESRDGQNIEEDREREHFRTSLGSILHEKASENRNVSENLPVSIKETAAASVSIPLIDIVRAVGALQQQQAQPQQLFDKEFVQRTVSEGVASGVKEALQMMMLHSPPAPSRHVARIGESLGGLDGPFRNNNSKGGYGDRESESMYLTPRYFREYAPADNGEEGLSMDNADSWKRKDSSRAVMKNKVKTDGFEQRDIEQDIVASRSAAEKLLLNDDSSSWESFSFDRPSEVTALLENKEFSEDDRSRDSDSVNSSVTETQRRKILYRNVATKDIVEEFGEATNPKKETESARKKRVQGEKSGASRGAAFGLKPLVSKVLEHSATHAVMELYDVEPPSFDSLSMTSSVILDESSDHDDCFAKSSRHRAFQPHDRSSIESNDPNISGDSDHDTEELSTSLSSQDMSKDKDSSSGGSRAEDVNNAADGMMLEMLKTLKLRQAKDSVLERPSRRSSSSRFDARSMASSDSLNSGSIKIGRRDDDRSVESILIERIGAARSSSDSSSDSDTDRGRHRRSTLNNFIFLR